MTSLKRCIDFTQLFPLKPATTPPIKTLGYAIVCGSVVLHVTACKDLHLSCDNSTDSISIS